MVEKPNKDGKPPTVEYQEEEIIVSIVRNDCLKYLIKAFFTHLTERKKENIIGWCAFPFKCLSSVHLHLVI